MSTPNNTIIVVLLFLDVFIKPRYTCYYFYYYYRRNVTKMAIYSTSITTAHSQYIALVSLRLTVNRRRHQARIIKP